MKKRQPIGATSITPVGYINQQGIFCSTAQKSFAQICAEAAEEREQIWG